VALLPRIAGLTASHAAWRATGSRAAGRVLIRALGSDDESVRAAAGMLLERGGRRAEPLLVEAAERRESLPEVLVILGDLGDPAAEPLLERFADDADPEVARAACDALRILQARVAAVG
jgi:HEAT repeat protein